MNPGDRDRVKELLAQAARITPGLRRDFIRQSAHDHPHIVAEALDLLPSLDDSAFMSAPTGAGMAGSLDSTIPAIEVPGARIGRYKLLQRLGEGGFGIVFMAEQTEPVIRRVALKIIKAGMDTRQVIARFEAERQALALMDHPNIARVFDAGATESGRPYFVMELVRGDSVTDYCDREQLPIEERIRLFESICGAVHHAHQKGIIHRDLKPSNVLVTVADGKPLPKVIDFGIAKATAVRLTEKTLFTEIHQLIGTPEYMSPEQAETSGVDIDTRSDVYALGVLLYELLVGAPPFEGRRLRSAPFAEMQRIIKNEEPIRPSMRYRTLAASSSAVVVRQNEEPDRAGKDDSAIDIARRRRTEPPMLLRSLRGDLDWIVMKCLEKERARRYGTASELADDVGRFLRREPVQAMPPSSAYRLRKLVQRHRGAFIAGALIAATLMLAAGVSIRYAMQARKALVAEQEQRKLVEAREKQTEQVAQFQAAMLSDIDIVRMGSGLKSLFRDQVRAGLSRGRETAEEAIEAQLADYDAIVAPVEPVDVARRVLDQFVLDTYDEAARRQFADQPRVEAQLLHTMGSVSLALGIYDRAEAALRRAVELRNALGDGADESLAESISQLAGLLSSTGRHEESERLHRESLALIRKLRGESDPVTITAMNNIAVLRAARGDHAGAEALLREALEYARKLPDDKQAVLASVLSSLGEVVRRRGDHAACEVYIRETLELRRKLFGEMHTDVADTLVSLGGVYYYKGEYAEAEKLMREALAIKRRLHGDDHEAVADTMGNLASVVESRGDRDAARKLHRDTLAMYRRLPGRHDIAMARSINNLAMIEMHDGQFDKAQALFQEALELKNKALGPDHPEMVLAFVNLALNHRRQENYTAAEPIYREAVGLAARQLPPNHPWRMTAELGLARTLLLLGKPGESLEYLSKIESDGDVKRLSPAAQDLYMTSFAEAHEELHKTKPAKGHSEEAKAWREKLEAWRPTTRPAPP